MKVVSLSHEEEGLSGKGLECRLVSMKRACGKGWKEMKRCDGAGKILQERIDGGHLVFGHGDVDDVKIMDCY